MDTHIHTNIEGHVMATIKPRIADIALKIKAIESTQLQSCDTVAKVEEQVKRAKELYLSGLLTANECYSIARGHKI